MSSREIESKDAPLPALAELAETLLGAAAVGAFELELARALTSIEPRQGELEPFECFRYRVLFFDVAQVSTTDPLVRHDVAVGLLHGAVEAGEPAWEAVRASGRREEIERLIFEHVFSTELLELLAYAPCEGLREFAVSQIESAGMRSLDSGEDSRPFERHLHAIGASSTAYRLEMARKQRRTNAPQEGTGSRREPAVLDHHIVAIAGGHAQLRGTAARLLQMRGIEMVSIPSSREAVRRERDILRLLQGCDLAIILVRQITHSTSDQVRRAAERLDVPVVYSNALSAVAIERQLFELER